MTEIPCTVAFGIQAKAMNIFSLVFRFPQETAKNVPIILIARAPRSTRTPRPRDSGFILLTWISVPIKAKMTGSRMIHILLKMSDTGLCSPQPSLLHCMLATRESRMAARPPAPS